MVAMIMNFCLVRQWHLYNECIKLIHNSVSLHVLFIIIFMLVFNKNETFQRLITL